MEPRVTLHTRLGNIRPHTLAVATELLAKFVVYFAWGIGSTGHHKAGRALDLMAYSLGGGVNSPGPIRKGWNKTVATYVWANRQRLGVEYVIYDRLIISINPGGYAYGGPNGDQWQHYPGTSHANHVHISFQNSPPAYRPPQVEDEDMPTAKEIADAVLDTPLALGPTAAARSGVEPGTTRTVRQLLVGAYATGQAGLAQLEALTAALDGDTPVEEPGNPTPDIDYTVGPGDNLHLIATRFGTTVEAIVAANNIPNPDLIQPGQVLTIPGGTQ